MLVFDDSAQNTKDTNGQLRFLAWSLNLACRFMTPSVVDKYVVFINLEKFSIFTCPSMDTSKETINMLCNMFPERMGHCICYKGPAYFTTFFNLVKPLIDPKTVSKIRFINGDVSDGSNNDTLLRDIIGDNWKEITGATSQVVKKGASPGYDHCAYWPRLMERIRLIQDKERRGCGNGDENDSTNNIERKQSDDHFDDEDGDNNSEFKYSVPRSNLTSAVSTPFIVDTVPPRSHGPKTPDMPKPSDNRFRTRGVKLATAMNSNDQERMEGPIGHNHKIYTFGWERTAALRRSNMIEVIWDLLPSFNVLMFIYMVLLLVVVAIILEGNEFEVHLAGR